MCKREYSTLLETCFIRDVPTPFHKQQSELLHLFQCFCVAECNGMGCTNSVFKLCENKNYVLKEKNAGRKGRELVVETFGIDWVLGGLWDGRV